MVALERAPVAVRGPVHGRVRVLQSRHGLLQPPQPGPEFRRIPRGFGPCVLHARTHQQHRPPILSPYRARGDLRRRRHAIDPEGALPLGAVLHRRRTGRDHAGPRLQKDQRRHAPDSGGQAPRGELHGRLYAHALHDEPEQAAVRRLPAHCRPIYQRQPAIAQSRGRSARRFELHNRPPVRIERRDAHRHRRHEAGHYSSSLRHPVQLFLFARRIPQRVGPVGYEPGPVRVELPVQLHHQPGQQPLRGVQRAA